MARSKKVTAAEREEARQYLLEFLQPNKTVYTNVVHVARSGMSRRVQVLVALTGSADHRSGGDREYIRDITFLVAKACGMRRSETDGAIVVGGCGFDAGFHIVYSLGQTLWPNGTPEPHGTRNGEPDRAGGYALKHSRI